MADDIVDQLNDLANSLLTSEGRSTAWCAAAEIIRLRYEVNQRNTATIAEDAIIEWLRSCKCQKYGCMHKRAADEITRLRAAGDVLADWAHIDHSPEQCEEGCEYLEALLAWREARRG